VADIFIAITNQLDLYHWVGSLEDEHQLEIVNQSSKDVSFSLFDLVIIDYQLNEMTPDKFMFDKQSVKSIVIGDDLSYQKQVKTIIDGARGYSDINIERTLIKRIVFSVLNEEIWLGRQLVPTLIRDLTTFNKNSSAPVQQLLAKISDQRLSSLTNREFEVAEKVYEGESYFAIAEQMQITERTVKAHLSSIFSKFNVKDRFQLVVFLKNVHLESFGE